MRDRIHEDNRRALPKFFGMLLAGGALGVAASLLSVLFHKNESLLQLPNALHGVIAAATPWGIPVLCGIMMAVGLWDYLSAKRIFAAWDGEDEDVGRAIDKKLNYSVSLSALTIPLSFFFLSASLIYMAQILAVLLEMMIALVCCILLQQRAVDLVRRMNPEKAGSVYEPKFRKKWLDSCDEAERQLIGQASYQAFSAGTTFCMVLWVALVLLSMVFQMNLLTIAIPLLLWVVMQISYFWTCIKLES